MKHNYSTSPGPFDAYEVSAHEAATQIYPLLSGNTDRADLRYAFASDPDGDGEDMPVFDLLDKAEANFGPEGQVVIRGELHRQEVGAVGHNAVIVRSYRQPIEARLYALEASHPTNPGGLLIHLYNASQVAGQQQAA